MKTLLRLTRLFRPYWRWMALGTLLALVVVLANMALLGVAGWFIAAMAAAGAAGGTMNYFTPAAAIRAFAIARTGGRYLERLVTHEATLRFLAGLRVWFYEHVEPLAPAGLQHYRGGDLLSRIGADIDALDNLYLRTLVPMAVAAATGLLAFAFLSLYSVPMAGIDLIFLTLAGAAVPLLTNRLASRPGARLVETGSRLRTAVVDTVQGMAELVVFGAAEAQIRDADRLSLELIADQERMSRIAGLGSASLGLLTNLAVWLVVLLGIVLVRRDEVPAVDLPMFALVVLGSFEAVAALPQAYQYLGHTLAAARRIFAVVDAPAPTPGPTGPSPAPSDHGLRLRDVSFRYADDAPWVLRSVDLVIPEGHHLAVVGPSGSGKSSIVNLLMRFWDCDLGEICLGGHTLRDYHSEDLRRMFSVVPQRMHLFNTTVRENLLVANPQADEAQLQAAAAAAHIHDHIAGLPDGYDSYVGEAGLKLSGGQARRLAIARALLKDAPIMILDEPTEGLDAATERRVMDSLLSAATGRTLVLITHRLKGLEHMDEIAVMDEGQIVERGTHGTLMAASGRYRQMHEVLTAS
ncbi:MAG TPA: thiol reductant ABC exporter subunit CydC [Gammaproteobacteria bacterium]|nr:thiol reductant ABC exporter subunit CydC [Gammaproteobacteria bacterium]